MAVRTSPPRIDERWIRHDWRLWIRPDIARWMKPGVDPADVIPALARERAQKEAARERARAAEDAAFDAEIERARRVQAALRAEVDELKAARARRRLEEAKYSPSQPRVPAGNPRGGQWSNRNEGGAGFGSFGNTDGEANAEGTGSEGDTGSSSSSENSDSRGITDPRVISDADPESVKPGEQYAQAGGRRGSTFVRINGQLVEVSPGQAAELQAVQARADGAITRVRELEPNWKPTPSAYKSVDGLIRKYRADAQEAQGHASELGKIGIGPGPFAGESISARGPERDFTAAERREINRIGSETGCQTCGTTDPGTKSGNFIADHQYPSAINPDGRAQRLYPQCATCSAKQGPYVSSMKGKSR
ncbi:MAG: hypothetical protein QOF63_4182 [Thermoanaerobaculia bacterium]|nr:hypothetical protein [Thermoanaerobaculia bacterium]